ncbi:MAG: flavin reductase family protein [bacterium]|nr:flavin reductase family protein [bacterium]
MVEFFPNQLSVNDAYKLLTSIYIPRPIAWVSTLSKNNLRNLAPFSFSMVVAVRPTTIAFAPIYDAQRKREKDTIINLKENPDCVIHMVTFDLVEKMNQTSAEVPYEVDEFELAQLTPVLADTVNAYRIQEAKVAFEAKVKHIIPIGSEAGSSNLVLAEVQKIHISESIWNVEKQRVILEEFQPVARLGGLQYGLISSTFELKRP